MFKLVVLSSLLAFAAASPGALGPLALGPYGGLGHLGYLGHLGVAAPLAAPVLPHLAAPAAVAWGAPALAAYNYRGPLSLAPGQPANVLAADGRPLDTLSVNLDRAAHYTARAVDHAGLHLLKKRSAPLLAAPLAWSHSARIDIPAARLIAPAPFVHGAPLGLHAPIAPWGHLGLGHLGHAAPLGHFW